MRVISNTRAGGVLHWLAALLLIGFLGMIAIAGLIYLAVRPDAGLRSLRSGLLETLDVKTSQRIEANVPGVVATLARWGVGFTPAPPEVKTALRSFHGGQAGVYQLANNPAGCSRAELVSLADAHLAERGWSRIVTVLDRDEVVMVFAPDDEELTPHDMTACVVVLSGRQLVIASARGDLTHIFKLAHAKVTDQLGRNRPQNLAAVR